MTILPQGEETEIGEKGINLSGMFVPLSFLIVAMLTPLSLRAGGQKVTLHGVDILSCTNDLYVLNRHEFHLLGLLILIQILQFWTTPFPLSTLMSARPYSRIVFYQVPSPIAPVFWLHTLCTSCPKLITYMSLKMVRLLNKGHTQCVAFRYPFSAAL